MNWPDAGPLCECGDPDCGKVELPRAAWEVAGGAMSREFLAVAVGHQTDREVIQDRGTWLVVYAEEEDE